MALASSSLRPATAPRPAVAPSPAAPSVWAHLAHRLAAPRSLSDERDIALRIAALCRKGVDDED